MKIGSPLPEKKARIEIIPLIDIMFFLLAAFMLASLSMIRLESAKNMDLPSAKTAKRDFKPDLVNIAVGKGGEIYIDKSQVTVEELHKFLAAKVKANTNVPVYISADRETKHGAVTRVLNEIHGEGIQRVSFAIAPAENPPK